MSMTQIFPLPCDEPEIEKEKVFLHNKENLAIEQSVIKSRRSATDKDVLTEVEWDTYQGKDGVKKG